LQEKIQKYILVQVFICIFTGYSNINAQVPIIYRQNNIQIKKNTGIPSAIYNVKSKHYDGTPEQIARQYLNENSTLLKMEKNLEDLEFVKVKKSPAGNHVTFRQVYYGIPIMNSDIVISINNRNMISMVINGHKSNINITTKPLIEKQQALTLAEQSLGIKSNDD